MTHRSFSGNPNRKRPPLDPELARVLGAFAPRRGLGRRDFLRSSAVVAGGAFLAACGISSESAQNAPATGGAATSAAGPEATSASTSSGGATGATEVSGPLNFSNWPFYIDVGEDEETSPTLQQFEQEYGIKVNYFEDVNSNDEYFGKVRNQLANGEPIGRDIMVLTDWMAGRMIQLGWLAELDKSNIPNISNLQDALSDVEFDPERQYSLPWQSGMTGIGFNPAVIDKEITSVNDLFDEALAGRVTMLSEMRDTMGLIMASMGLDPVEHEFADYQKAIDRLQQAVDSGQIRQFTGNEYTTDLAAGNIAAAIAWSGDIIQLQFDNPDLQFIVPDEGSLLWSDNMLIPQNAAHKVAAETFMNFVYQPEIAAQIAAWVNYITPVGGAKEAMEQIDPELTEFELIFPPDELLQNTFDFKILSEDEERRYQEAFQSVIGA
ncbi:MAG: extracellular solute-binding protein [Egibacteraceae bacterium]